MCMCVFSTAADLTLLLIWMLQLSFDYRLNISPLQHPCVYGGGGVHHCAVSWLSCTSTVFLLQLLYGACLLHCTVQMPLPEQAEFRAHPHMATPSSLLIKLSANSVIFWGLLYLPCATQKMLTLKLGTQTLSCPAALLTHTYTLRYFKSKTPSSSSKA